MTRHRFSFAQSVAVGLFGLTCILAAFGCDPSLAVPAGNRQPIAEARVLGMMGQNAVVDYRGSPVEVTLDASFSKDGDGSIKKYRWLSGRLIAGAAPTAGSAAAGSSAAAGTGGSVAGTGAAAGDDDAGAGIPDVERRWVPEGAPDDWPEDIQQPKVTLPEGEYSFVLWVEDDKGLISTPSTLKVTVRTPLDPAVMTCTTAVYPEIAAACKSCICSASDACRDMLTKETVCNATCWGLLSCIASKCPTYVSGGDPACLVANCSSFLGSAAAAGMIAPCLMDCRDKCRAM